MSTATTQTYSVSKYSPDSGFTTGGLLMFIASLAAVGALLGYAAFWAHKIFYIVLLFPALIGFAIGAVGIRMTKKGHIRNPWMGGLAGFLAGVLAMTATHYFEYDEFRSEIKKLPPGLHELAAAPPEERQLALATIKDGEDRARLEETISFMQIKSLPQFMDFKAKEGVSIKGKGRGDGMNLGYTGSWIYWGLETLIVAGITFVMVFDSTSQPYCRKCQRWKTPRVLGHLRGQPAETTAFLQQGNLSPIAAKQSGDDPRNLRVTVACCDTCVGQTPVDVKLEAITVTKEGEQAKTLTHLTYPPDALPTIASLFTPAHIQEPTPPTPPTPPAA
jgi:hypothetical protein